MTDKLPAVKPEEHATRNLTELEALYHPENLEDWVKAGYGIGRAQDTLRWAQAHWWASGARYGEAREQYAEIVGLHPKTLDNYALVAQAFPPGAEIRGCPFTMHEALAAWVKDDPEKVSHRREVARRLIAQAVEDGKTRDDLRETARELAAGDGPLEPARGTPRLTPKEAGERVWSASVRADTVYEVPVEVMHDLARAVRKMD